MHLGPRSALPIVFLVLGSHASIGQDSPAVSALNKKGLERSGRYFVIEDEQPVLAKLKESRAVVARYTTALARKVEAEQAAADLAQLEQRRADLQEHLTAMNQRITEIGFQQQTNAMPRQGNTNNPQQGGPIQALKAQRNMLQMHFAEVSAALKNLKGSSPKAPDPKDLADDVKAALDAAQASLAEIRQKSDAVVQRYADLNADPSVKASLADLEKSTRSTFKLGPSDAFKTALKTLDQAEKKVLAKKTPVSTKKKVKSRK